MFSVECSMCNVLCAVCCVPTGIQLVSKVAIEFGTSVGNCHWVGNVFLIQLSFVRFIRLPCAFAAVKYFTPSSLLFSGSRTHFTSSFTSSPLNSLVFWLHAVTRVTIAPVGLFLGWLKVHRLRGSCSLIGPFTLLAQAKQLLRFAIVGQNTSKRCYRGALEYSMYFLVCCEMSTLLTLLLCFLSPSSSSELCNFTRVIYFGCEIDFDFTALYYSLSSLHCRRPACVLAHFRPPLCI